MVVKRIFLLVLTLMVLLAGCAKQERSHKAGCCLRAELIIEALEKVGVCTAQEAVDVWVQGLKTRNAAMQYAVMDGTLRKAYVKALEQSAPDWVTGVSSAWVSGYEVFDTDESQEINIVSLHVMTETRAGPADTFLAVLSLYQEGGYWRIGGICADEGLSVFTGFLE